MSESQRVEEVFLAALEKPPGSEREGYVFQACRGDAELHGAVERLLAAHARAGKFLEHPPTEVIATSDSSGKAPTGSRHDGTPDLVGARIGPYKLLEEIGEGGMGVVYMAEQEKPLRRRVALKVIKPGLDSRQVVARFEAERQALALMDHPNIARVLDAGTTDSGRPYFVMELVRGVPIHDFCDQNKLPVHERLELFTQVCQAVQHAHQKGIIHRDIKPSNVLVTINDDRAVPKVIDFGVAKAVNQQLTDKTLFTQFAQMIGTPLYMSPEQAQMTSLDVDTRTDIYSLGVLLYELLTGTTPFDRHRFGTAAFDEVRRIIREEVPPRPSLRISTLGQQRTVVAALRQAQPERLSQALRGDLDWIVMKALEKDRSRRYDTVIGLAADVRRYLAQEPVEAGPPSAAYRLSKFTRRNRAAIATVGAIFGVLLLGIVASTWQAIRATRAEQRAEAARAAATTQELKERDAKLLAEAERQKADDQRELAENRQRHIERLAYSTQITQAKRTWEHGEVAEAKALLNSTPTNLRCWEYGYLAWLFESPLILQAHRSGVEGLAFSRDGHRLASFDGSTTKFWDLDSLRELRTLEERPIDISPDLRLIACQGYFQRKEVLLLKEVLVLDVETGKTLCRLPPSDNPHFIRNGAQLAAETTNVRVELIARLLLNGEIPEGEIKSHQFAMWDTSSGRLIRSIPLPNREQVLAISADGERFATVDKKSVHIWETETNRKLKTITMPDSPQGAVGQLSGDGSRLAMFFKFGFRGVLDTDSGDAILEPNWYVDITDMFELTSDGRRLLYNSPEMWDIDAGRETFSRSIGAVTTVPCIKSHPDGRQVVVGLDNGNILIWNVTPRPDVLSDKLVSENGNDPAIAFNHDGGQLVSGHQEGEVLLWNTRVRSDPKVIEWHADEVQQVAFSPDGHKVTSASKDRIVVTDIVTGQTIASVDLPQRPPQNSSPHPLAATGISSDGSLVAREIMATGNMPRVIEIWAPLSRKCITTFEPTFKDESPTVHARVTSKIAFSPDNRHVAAGHGDGCTVIWDVATGREVVAMKAEAELYGKPILDVTFCNGGTRIATCGDGRSILVWDAVTGARKARLDGHINTVRRIAYSPDDSRIASWSEDHTARIWDPELGIELLRLGQEIMISTWDRRTTALAFSSDGDTLAISDHGPVHLLNGRTPDDERGKDIASPKLIRATLRH